MMETLEIEISFALGPSAACEVDGFVDKIVALVRHETWCSRHDAELMVADLRREMELALEEYRVANVSEIAGAVRDLLAESTADHDDGS
jgi:hypothetical protein